jgi:hypothetical protein
MMVPKDSVDYPHHIIFLPEVCRTCPLGFADQLTSVAIILCVASMQFCHIGASICQQLLMALQPNMTTQFQLITNDTSSFSILGCPSVLLICGNYYPAIDTRDWPELQESSLDEE